MANEYLQRTPTSGGNRRVWTWSGWVKRNTPTGTRQGIFAALNNAGTIYTGIEFDANEKFKWFEINLTSPGTVVNTSQTFRDVGNWMHILAVLDSTASSSQNRAKIYVNGTLITLFTTDDRANIPINMQSEVNGILYPSYIGSWGVAAPTLYSRSELADVFFVDGQALTPDVFGFYKQGKGYISVGSTQSTDFRPGQWVPKTPRVIKTEINRRGGFGVNGFYLPMNDSNNFGADFHCTPNSIIKLQENLPQPRCRIDGVGDYTGALRDDPFKQYLVLALPFVSGGLQSGFGDYAPSIKGSGSPKTITVNGSLATSNTVSLYYGSSAFLNNGGTSGTQFLNTSHSDYALGLQDFTIECWIYPTSLYNYWTLLSTRPNDGGFADAYHIGTDASGSIAVYSNAYDAKSSNGVINVNQWSHIAAVRTGSTLTLYLNGVAVAVNTNYTKNLTKSDLTIGRLQNLGTNLESATGYIQDLRIYKGVAKYKGGFDVPNHYTPVGIATWRAVPDTTANNFATLNPLVPSVFSSGNRSISNGNLTVTTITTGNGTNARSTIGVSTGKWYAETYVSADTNGGGSFLAVSGIGREDNQTNAASGDHINYYGYNGNKYDYDNGSPTISSYGSTYTTGDIIGIIVNADNGQVTFYKNGVSQGVAKTFSISQYPLFIQMEDGASGATVTYNMNFGQNPTFSGNTSAGTFTDSNGKGLFKYQPPSGFLALCEDNLPTPAISNPGKHFKTVLWTGDGNTTKNVVGVGFTPDLVWVKNRNNADFHRVYDSVRGVKRAIYTNSTAAEQVDNLISFDPDGFTFEADSYGGGINDVGEGHVAWCWKAGAGTTSTNTNGSITSVVSVNQDAGFSIVSWTGNGTSGATVGHGINKPPKFIIVQTRQGTNNREKPVYHVSTGTNYATVLNGTSAGFVNSAFWNNTAPSSSLITLGNDQNTNQNTSTYIAYCWAEIEGFSKFGSFSGNSSTDGVFVYTGFRPAWVMIKRTDSTDSWAIFDSSRDSTNPVERLLRAESSNAEATMTSLVSNPFGDLLSNGFKVRNTSTIDNVGSYVFAAFAESAFSYSNAK